jgi:hypothetical protein
VAIPVDVQPGVDGLSQQKEDEDEHKDLLGNVQGGAESAPETGQQNVEKEDLGRTVAVWRGIWPTHQSAGGGNAMWPAEGSDWPVVAVLQQSFHPLSN